MLKHTVKPEKSIVFQTYWKFAAKRQSIYFARLYGTDTANETGDQILSKHRFTNVYRASDRVSQYLIRNVQYDQKWSPDDLLFRTLLFKLFNKIETWEFLEQELGPLTWETYSFDQLDACLAKLKRRKAIYSAAYIMPSGQSSFGHEAKHQNHLKLIERIMANGGARRLRDLNSLEGVFEYVRSFPTIGPFTGFQYTIDLNYSPLLEFEESDFVVAGPGALDGIRKCFTDLGSYSPQDIINYMFDIQDQAFERYAPTFQSLWGRKMQPIDCQNVFCEVDKYSRVAHPDVSGISGRKRIKQIYKPHSIPIAMPWYPPKWGINEEIAHDPKLEERNQQGPQVRSQMSLWPD